MQAPAPTLPELLASRVSALPNPFPTEDARRYHAAFDALPCSWPKLHTVLRLQAHNCRILAAKGALSQQMQSPVAMKSVHDLGLEALPLMRFLPHLVIPRGTAAAMQHGRSTCNTRQVQLVTLSPCHCDEAKNHHGGCLLTAQVELQ